MQIVKSACPLLWILIASTALAAHSKPPSQATIKAIDEAEGYETLCLQPDKAQHDLCAANLVEFTRNYIAAKAGQHLGQQNVAYELSGGDFDPIIGIQHNHIQACAWALVAELDGSPDISETDSRNAHAWCDHLDALQRQSAEARAKAIQAEIAAAPATLPTDQPDH